MHPVDLIGIGVASAAGSDVDALFEAIASGRSAGADRPDLVAAGVRTARAASLTGALSGADPLLHAIRSALKSAGDPDLDPARVALVVGTSAGGMRAMEAFHRALDRGEPQSIEAVRGACYPAPAMAAARALGVRGPVRVVCAACASSLVALAIAIDLLAEGRCDLAIAAGHDDLSVFVHAGFDALGALAPGPTRPFRARRDGLLAGEGAAAVVLRRRGSSRPRARVLGVGMSADARHVTAPDPDGRGLARAIEAALADAGQSPEAVDFVSAHGTGTPHNDVSETRALKAALGEHATRIPVVSWKPVLGHAMGAAGLLELAGVVLALERGVVPGTSTSGDPDPDCDLDVAADGPRRIPAKVALKVSSGFGGANAAAIVAKP